MNCWKENVGSLSANFRCIMIDLPGHGRSEKGMLDYSLSFYVKVVKELIEVLKLSNVTLVGHSMGGQIAMHIALRHPFPVKQLVLVSPAGFERFTEKESDSLLTFAKNQFPELANTSTIRYAASLNYATATDAIDRDVEYVTEFFKPENIASYKHMFLESMRGMLEEQVIDRLKLLSQPILVICGANDRLIPNKVLHPLLTIEAIAGTAASQIKNCRVEVLTAAGHMVQIDAAEDFNHLLKDFAG